MSVSSPEKTERVQLPGSIKVQGFELTVSVRGQEPRRWRSTEPRCSVGAHASNELVVQAPQVSRFHCEFLLGPRGLLVRDLGSSNGTFVDGVMVNEAYVRSGSRLTIGTASLEVALLGENVVATSSGEAFGKLVGRTPVMRAVFARLERAASADITVLLEGETGTGKEEAAAGLHAQSVRAKGPFVVVDCSALPETLLESELFGHERGAFTGATSSRAGAFEEAAGGTIFLDEIGELPLELQPKLLRVLEAREFRRVGANEVRTADVRVIAATNRDLRKEVNEGRFRADLFYRLAVLKIALPPLREHPDDLPLVARALASELGAAPSQLDTLFTPAFLQGLRQGAWPGNARELRNFLETCLLFSSGEPAVPDAVVAAPAVDATRPLADERKRHAEAFERAYVDALLALHEDDVPAAARAAGVARGYLYRLIKKVRPSSHLKGD